jgi:DNA-binding transcriptional LysR family regulator
MLDVHRLATLRAVLAHGSFSAAGQALGLTQPAISRQITLLERQAGAQLVRRTHQGIRPTEAGRLLAAGELDLSLVFEHDFEPDPPPGDLELVPLFTDPARVLLPARHPLAARETLALEELAGETWIRAHDGSAARLLDHLLATAGLHPRVLLAGHGDEPVETQVHVVAGDGVALAYQLNVLINPAETAVRPLAGPAPARHVQAALLRDQRSPGTRALLELLRELAGD